LPFIEIDPQHHAAHARERYAQLRFVDAVQVRRTGGLLACLHLCPDSATKRPRYSAQEILDFYIADSPKIFSIPFSHRIRSAAGFADERYPAAGLEGVLERYFGSTFLSELVKPCLITAYDIRRRRAILFTQHDAIDRTPKDFLVKDVARATSAAPTYFEVARVKSRSGVSYPLIDGGVFANNPALCAYAEARTHFGVRAADMAILSIGTGTVTKPYPYEEAKDWANVAWIRPLFDIMISGLSETVDYECRLAFDAIGAPEQYLRVNISLDRLPPKTTSDLDDASSESMNGMVEMGAEAAESMSRELNAFAGILTGNSD
jgi:patatin-like phospholipase/acyl hydrolase